MRPIVFIPEARKILGKKYDHLSDEEVTQIISDLDELAKLTFDMYRDTREKKLDGN